MKNSKIVMYKGDEGGCGVLRIIQPGNYLKKLGYNVSIENLDTSRTIYPNTQICVFQREYVQPDVLDYVSWLKSRGVKIVYDLDDDIFDVPKSNPTYEHFKRPETRKKYEFFLKNADLVTVSTEYLRGRLRHYNSNIVIVPNCIDFDTWPGRPPHSSHSGIRLGWAGSATHYEDLMLVFQPIKNLIQKFKSLSLHFLGFCPKEYQDAFGDRVIYHTGGNYKFYQHKLAQLSLDVGFIPLVVNNLNKSKSPVKYLEYASQKIPCVASKEGPYKDLIKDSENGYLANDPIEWEHKLGVLIKNKGVRNKVGENSYIYCQQNYNMQTKIYLWEKYYKQLLTTPVPEVNTKGLKKSSENSSVENIPTAAQADDVQIIHDIYNISKLFAKNKKICLMDSSASFHTDYLVNAGAAEVTVLHDDRPVVDHFKRTNQDNRLSYFYYQFDKDKRTTVKNDQDLLISINNYPFVQDKKIFFSKLTPLLRKSGTGIITYLAPKPERDQFLNLLRYYFAVNSTILMREFSSLDSEKHLLAFVSRRN